MMKRFGAAALVAGILVAGAAHADTPDQRIYDLALRTDATVPHWQEVARVPRMLSTDNRWSVQRVRSKRLAVSTGAWSASAYMVKSRHAPVGMPRLTAPDRIAATAAGADMTLRLADDFTLLARTAAMHLRTRASYTTPWAKGIKRDRMLIGGGVEGPAGLTLIADYVSVRGGGRRSNPLIALTDSSDRAGTGGRLTLAGGANPGVGQLGWTFTLASMQRSAVRYGQAVIAPAQADRSAAFGLNLGF